MRGQCAECKSHMRIFVQFGKRYYTDWRLFVCYNFAFSGAGLVIDTKSVIFHKKSSVSMELHYIHMLFFISLSAPMTSTASVLPVAF